MLACICGGGIEAAGLAGLIALVSRFRFRHVLGFVLVAILLL